MSDGMSRHTTHSTCAPGPTPDTVRAADGRVLTAPEGWILLSPGDAALTRRVKAAGDHWIVQEKKGRKVFSRGVWAPGATIDAMSVLQATLEATAEAIVVDAIPLQPLPRD